MEFGRIRIASLERLTALAGNFEVFGDRLSQVEVMVRNSNTNTGANSNVAAAAAAAPPVFSVPWIWIRMMSRCEYGNQQLL